jgi:hypothetical protein
MGVKMLKNDVKELRRQLLSDVLASTVEVSDNAFIIAEELINNIILEAYKEGYSDGYDKGYAHKK